CASGAARDVHPTPERLEDMVYKSPLDAPREQAQQQQAPRRGETGREAPVTSVAIANRPASEPAEDLTRSGGHGLLHYLPRAGLHGMSTLWARRDPGHAHQRASTTPLHVMRPNVALAGLQLLIGYQWLVSGVDKALLGTFPAQIGHLLVVQLDGGRLPS